jgi:hypothetical protein
MIEIILITWVVVMYGWCLCSTGTIDLEVLIGAPGVALAFWGYLNG